MNTGQRIILIYILVSDNLYQLIIVTLRIPSSLTITIIPSHIVSSATLRVVRLGSPIILQWDYNNNIVCLISDVINGMPLRWRPRPRYIFYIYLHILYIIIYMLVLTSHKIFDNELGVYTYNICDRCTLKIMKK